MKRTKNINRARFRKKLVVTHASLFYGGILGAALFLTGCDDTTTRTEYLNRPYTDAVDCYKHSDLSYDDCVRGQKQAVEEAMATKRFSSREECLRDNPNNDCQQNGSGSHATYYPYPHYYGYNTATGTGQAFYQGRSSNSFSSSQGKSFNAKTSSVPRTYTTTRGGFGSSFGSSSHSSFSSSSSRSSFGG
ncbi:DUF1190 domain containing protein [Erwinia phage vB_EamM_RisingSun]|uniref:DUF1190 domain containing protein n=2 Tax=Risingsunvirus risingsun TaxID=2560435 RepID=A0A223LGI1_9CAUD|nr:DUF1190 domain containing protein [Erwinia phage vB_EamM_RisingSun]ASU03517.1 DUF1190 domain containing protein [Erwinia phage vB_EamM_RisingSun]ASU03761.1 DUF1190 domain containing protein [Erwinia phage vB_EamM_Joad]